MLYFKSKSFGSPGELTDFINANKLKKDNIVSITQGESVWRFTLFYCFEVA
jgi:hypothetical protein